MSGTVRQLLEDAVARFERAGLAYGHGTTNALDEAAWLILHAACLPLDALNAHLDDRLEPGAWDGARALIEARVRTRKPAAYLLHEAWLGAHRFYVDERVIVPRSYLFELIAKRPGPVRFPTVHAVLDLCTGSACLAILAALRFPHARVDAVDLSDDALAVAQRNVADYGLGERVHLLKSDLFAALAGRRYDLIVSNPPYVKATAMRALPAEYRSEPRMALASGADGLDHTRRILAHARAHLTARGLLMVEIGRNRAALERAYPQLPLCWPRTSAGAGYVFTLRAGALPPPS